MVLIWQIISDYSFLKFYLVFKKHIQLKLKMLVMYEDLKNMFKCIPIEYEKFYFSWEFYFYALF